MDAQKSVDQLCVEHGIDWKQVAERSGLEEQRVLAIVMGRWTPSPTERDKVAAVFGLTRDQIHDEVLTLLLAGFETTANGLAWTWALLMAHPWAVTNVREQRPGRVEAVNQDGRREEKEKSAESCRSAAR